jgi:hypothetical protein
MKSMPALVIVVVVVAAMIFVPILRRLLSLIIRLAIFFVGVAVAAAGVAMIMNNETIFERPGLPLRVQRFVSMNSAAASASGSGSVTCDMGASTANQPQAAPTPAVRKHAARTAAVPEADTAHRVPPTSGPASLEDVYPELIRRSFPGISRQKLFDLSEQTVTSLGGWKVVKKDPGTYTLDCIYTSRIFKWEDDVRISIEPSGEIDVCSRSGTARPDSTSMLRYFPGDLGANVGHIKEFYETLEPKMDEVYKEEQDKENAKKPH